MQVGDVLLDRYELVGRIGEGATSAVWEATDARTGERVAVKAISLDEAGWRAEVRDRFQQEARLLALGAHEHLVGVRDAGETDEGYLFTVLDKLSGETLAARLARAPRIGWREAAGIALQIARGLAALHARGVVHRDIKPANVILHREGSADPVAKIIDLGVSKVRAAAADPLLYATLTATGQVLGTPEYMSFEQATGDRDIDARSDVWAVGVVLHEMLAGRRPFEAPNVNAVLAAIRRAAPPRLADVAPRTPAPLAAVVDRCLERAREDRFADGAALAAAIEAAILEADRAPAAPIPEADPAPAIPPPAGPKIGVVAVAIAIAALAAVGLALIAALSAKGRGAVPSASAPAIAAPSAPSPSALSPSASSSAEVPRSFEIQIDTTPSAGVAPPPRASARTSPGKPATRVNDAGF